MDTVKYFQQPADKPNYISIFISNHLLSKIPAPSQVIEDVFENADEGILQEHINKAIQLIQEQQWKEKFKGFHVAPQTIQITKASEAV